MNTSFAVDVVIIGAGIAGLWLHHRLRQQGVNSVLLERQAIGQGQTFSAQGIIHGGTKYALNGILSSASQAIGDMPDRWTRCLTGQGDVDLSVAKILSPHQYLWSSTRLSAKLTSFFASKALSSRMQPVESNRPTIFQHSDFNGLLYQLTEPVLCIPSVMAALAAPYRDSIFLTADRAQYRWQYDQQQQRIEALHLDHNITLTAQHYVLTAGEGNADLIHQLQLTQPEMQRRPLQMLLCRATDPQNTLPELYAHYLDGGSKPAMTITSHYDQHGQCIWYIGGDIAEHGVHLTPPQLQAKAYQQLTAALPWFSFPRLSWHCHRIDRAEPRQAILSRPDAAFLHSKNNCHIAWPTKLALAPNLADKAITAMTQQGLQPRYQHNALHQCLARAPIATPLWDTFAQ